MIKPLLLESTNVKEVKNNLTLDELIQKKVPEMKILMEEYVKENVYNYFDEYELNIHWEDVFDSLIPILIENMDEEECKLMSYHDELFVDLLFKAVNNHSNFFINMERELLEEVRDAMAYQRHPLAYHGLRQSHFL